MPRQWVEAFVTFPGIHHWPEAPPPVSYLKTPHRHVFHVRARKQVTSLDRETEFILLGQALRAWLADQFPPDPDGSLHLGSASCEMLATALIAAFSLSWCGVWEDGENGAVVEV